jgi:hypothetical protein
MWSLILYKALAATPGGTSRGSVVLPNPLQVESISGLLERIVQYLSLYIAPPIVTLMIFWGAFQILTAAGNPEKITQGRKTITYAVVGYVIILIGWGFVSIIKEVLGLR